MRVFPTSEEAYTARQEHNIIGDVERLDLEILDPDDKYKGDTVLFAYSRLPADEMAIGDYCIVLDRTPASNEAIAPVLPAYLGLRKPTVLRARLTLTKEGRSEADMEVPSLEERVKLLAS